MKLWRPLLVHPIDVASEEILRSGQYLLVDRNCVNKLKENIPSDRKKKGFSSLIRVLFIITRID